MPAIRILFLGDVVGEPGRKAVIEQLPLLKQSEGLDFCIVNGENSAGGKGITPRIAIDLLRAGAAVITTGDHVWDQQEIVDYFPTEPRLLRPLNYPEGTPGAGSVVLETANGRIGVIQAQGRSFIQPPLENPYLAVEKEAERLRADGVKVIVLDFHAETTSEKLAMGRMLDGKVSLVVGTHTHVQTADENIFPGGTGYLTDAGMCGPEDSILAVLRANGMSLLSSCGDGICGTCETAVLDGIPDHRDSVLDDDEKAVNDSMMVCVSRSLTERLVLDL